MVLRESAFPSYDFQNVATMVTDELSLVVHSDPKKDFSTQATPNLVLKVSHLPAPWSETEAER